MSVYFAAIKLVPITTGDNSSGQIYMSKRLLQRLGLEQKQSIHICLGKKMKEVHVGILKVPSNEIHLPQSFLNEFSIGLTHQKFLAKHIQTKRILYLGPVIALVTEIQSPGKDQEPDFGSIHTFCRELQQITEKQGGLFYVFHYQDISDECITGYYFDQNKWVCAKLPMPDVVYNRVHSRKTEQTSLFKTFRKKLEQFSIPMFNDRFLSKWEVYQHLMQESTIQPFMPETRLLSEENLSHFLDQYESVFIKPVHGSQGRNISKLMKDGESVSLQTSRTPLADRSLKKYLRKDIFYRLKPFLTNRIYIIQQGISLINFEEKTIDFRVLVHKNREDLWEVTSLVARISAEQQFVSNLAKGGTIMKPLKALTACFNTETSLQIIALMKEISINAAEIISRNTSGLTGELGIDIGIDTSGNPWIIEINSKPSKNFEDHSTKIRPSAKAIFHFCTKLALDGVLEMED
jgi:glutathione synthase/RimK-type ligase-like ATP-grasp enzyme